jgi:subtilisin-like proprotein convertase family protein
MNITSFRPLLAWLCCLAGITSLSAAPVTFTNATKISIPAPPGGGNPTGAVSEPYPSSINVNGLNGRVSSVTVKLRSFTHTYPEDVDVMLVHSDSGGQKTNILILSDIGGGTDVDNATLIFKPGVADVVPNPIVAGTYRPSNLNLGGADVFPFAPSPTSATSLDIFNGRDPNGTWSLYVVDDEAPDAGSIDGWELTLDTSFAPFITGQPQSLIVSNGGTATFNVGAVGTAPLRYQWRVNCKNLPNATNSFLTLSNVSLANVGNYSVTVINGSGQATSIDASLALNGIVSPRITHAIIGTSNMFTWPKFDVRYELEETPSLTPNAVGEIPWATAAAEPTFGSNNTYGSLLPFTAGNHFFRVSSSGVRIITQPRGQSANIGDTVTLSVTATGAPPLSYQWRLNGFALIGQTNPSINVVLDQLSDFGAYQVTVQDAREALSSGPAVIRLNGVETVFADAFASRAAFVSSPNNTIHGTTFGATTEAGEPTHAGVPGGRSVWIAWRAPSNGYVRFHTRGSGFDTLLAAYTGSALTGLTPVASDDDTGGNLCSLIQFNVTGGVDYAIAIDGLAGAAGHLILSWDFQASTSVTVPIIDVQPQDKIVPPNQPVTFTVSAHGTGQLTTLNYQWLFNGTPIPGKRDPSLDVGGAGSTVPLTLGFYSVLVSNGVLGVQSRAASLQFSTNELRFVPKLLVDSICGLDPLANVNADCCGAKAISNPKLLTGSAGTLAGSLAAGGSTPGSVCSGRTQWMWITNGWACSKQVTLTATIKDSTTAATVPATLAVFDEGSVFFKKCTQTVASPAILKFTPSSGRIYWIAVGYDTMSATGAVSYSIGSSCP